MYYPLVNTNWDSFHSQFKLSSNIIIRVWYSMSIRQTQKHKLRKDPHSESRF